MNKILIGFLVLTSTSAFADELIGLKCTTKYLLHEIRRTPYNTNRITSRDALLGGRSVLGIVQINNDVKSFKEEFHLDDSRDFITYSLDVQEDISTLTVIVSSRESENVLINDQEFKTRDGFSQLISLGGLVQIGTQQALSVTLTCLPVKFNKNKSIAIQP